MAEEYLQYKEYCKPVNELVKVVDEYTVQIKKIKGKKKANDILENYLKNNEMNSILSGIKKTISTYNDLSLRENLASLSENLVYLRDLCVGRNPKNLEECLKQIDKYSLMSELSCIISYKKRL